MSGNNIMRRPPGAVIIVAVVVVVIVLWRTLTTVQAGHVGIVTTFGRVHDEALGEGAHLIAPWNSVQQMSLRTEEVKEEMDVPTKEGVTVRLEASLLYSLQPERAAEVFKKVGPEYAEKVVKPQFRSAARSTTVNYEAKDLYTGARSDVESMLETATKDLVVPYGIRCEKVLLRKMELPQTIKTSIDQKMVADQKAQAMEYELKSAEQDAKKKKIEAEAIANAKLAAMKIELETAEQESKKKQIEAQAIAQAAETIRKGLDEPYIRYLWVQALESAAKNHSTTIYVPTGKDGLPMIGTVAAAPPSATSK